MTTPRAKAMLQAAFGPPAYGVDEMAAELAGMNHAKWLEARRLSAREGGHDMLPRVKTKNGKTFDIAVDWSVLDPIWKGQEMEGSKAYITSLLPVYQEMQRSNAALMESAASQVHEIWKRQNAWAKEDQPQLFVDYTRLPDDEKEKDRVVVRNVFRIFETTS
jgi:alpha-galactosidase/6-phospho-beta-glucosidase family protein